MPGSWVEVLGLGTCLRFLGGYLHTWRATCCLPACYTCHLRFLGTTCWVPFCRTWISACHRLGLNFLPLPAFWLLRSAAVLNLPFRNTVCHVPFLGLHRRFPEQGTGLPAWNSAVFCHLLLGLPPAVP